MARLFALVTAILLCTSSALASESPVYTGLLSNTAVGGYDTVSYFEAGGPAKGSARHTVEYNGATWRFANSENLALFKEEPERYAPAYGGYCAWAISQGNLAKGDPKYWTVRDGRLYLNYSQSVHDQWLEDPEGFIRLANEKWPKVLE
ncbi:YHS domain-containing (seleno)protein [uncultured Marinobacter sp.]|uniref:YHS domain-containing (seleno)protein n=1 Tax=uncultured Marinobacter sp. TaxID=187379 RepID=UPI0030DB3016|tara:strand:+ start:5180 stop:5623 length:444 start_codon:yes stop_codon:yes gene_type:complete